MVMFSVPQYERTIGSPSERTLHRLEAGELIDQSFDEFKPLERVSQQRQSTKDSAFAEGLLAIWVVRAAANQTNLRRFA
jgi:hypothetical protein